METTRRPGRGDVAGRVLAGLMLGYAGTPMGQAVLSAVLALMMARADAVWLGTMLILPVVYGTAGLRALVSR